MYSVLRYSEMALDRKRMEAYEQAIARYVTPSSIVLDLGAGTGILSLLAARAGAKCVHACELESAVYLLAELAESNSLAERIHVHHGSSRDLRLCEKADVIISDLRGSLPMFEGHFATLRDAKERLLAPNGVLLPQRDDLFVAGFESSWFAERLKKSVEPFTDRGFNADAVWRTIANTPLRDSNDLSASDLLTTAGKWGYVTYGSGNAVLEGEVTLSAQRAGRIHGLAVWFEATIADGLGYSTEPGGAGIYGRLLLPCIEVLRLEHHDRLRVLIRSDEDGEQMAWEIVQEGPDGGLKHRLVQTTFFGELTSSADLVRRSGEHRPTLTALGILANRVLERVDGHRLTRELLALDPDAAKDIRRLLARYTS